MADETDIEGSDLAALVAQELAAANGFDANDLGKRRDLAVEYMRGEMSDLPAAPNRSQLTSRDFADAVSWIAPGIVSLFMSSDMMVKYELVKDGDDAFAKDATEYTNYTFRRENPGYRIVYNATIDSLSLGNGLAASYWEPERIETKWFRNVTELELSDLLNNQGWQPTGVAKPGKPNTIIDEVTGAEIEEPTYSVKLQKVDRQGAIKDCTLLPENLFLNQEATTIEDARFCAYLHDNLTRGDLMDRAQDYGWDTEDIENLPAYRTVRGSTRAARDSDRWVGKDSPVKSGDLIDLYECYIRADDDEDGIPELIQVWYAGDRSGGTVLSSEEYEDETPFTDIPCYPMPHRWDAQSVFDRTADIQRAKTVLLRQATDNLYAANLPMIEAEVGTVLNPDILVAPKFGGIIWRKSGSMATSPIRPQTVPFVADKAFTAMQYMDEVVSKRTGVSRTTMALDPNALQNQTATAVQQQRDAGYTQIELIARNMAELGWAPFFRKRLKLAVKYGKVARRIPSRNTDKDETGKPVGFKTVNPSQWDPEMAVTIDVGLGTGSKDRDMAMLTNIQQNQLMMANMLGQYGFTDKALEFLPMIRDTAVKIAESAGLKNPDSYYPALTDDDVTQMKQQAAAPKPNPKLEEIKAQGEVQASLKQVDAQVSMHEAQLKAEGEVVKNQAELEADLATKQADRDNAIAIETIKQQGEAIRQQRDIELEMWKIEQQNAMERERMANAAHIAAMKPDPQPAAAN